MNTSNDLIYLQKKYPHLYDIEMMIREVKYSTGYGEVSFNIRILNGKIDKGSVKITTERSKIYTVRESNELT